MPGKRISRKFVPRPSHGRGRRDNRPNVFIQQEEPEGKASQAPAGPVTAGGSEAPAGTAARRPVRARAGTARANIFTRTLSREMKQLTFITALCVEAVVVLKFVL